MDRSALAKALFAPLTAMLVTAAPAFAQKPQEPLGDLLQVIPLPEAKDGKQVETEVVAEAPSLPASTPAVPPGRVVPIQLPPSEAVEPLPRASDTTDEEPETAESEALPVGVPDSPGASDEGEKTAAEDQAAREAAEADAAWEAIQEQRRQGINAVEAPVVEALNAEAAARAAAETRRIEEEMAAYRRSLIEAEEEARRIEAEHAAAMAEHDRRVAREQAEHRARVEACLAGEREACRPPP